VREVVIHNALYTGWRVPPRRRAGRRALLILDDKAESICSRSLPKRVRAAAHRPAISTYPLKRREPAERLARDECRAALVPTPHNWNDDVTTFCMRAASARQRAILPTQGRYRRTGLPRLAKGFAFQAILIPILASRCWRPTPTCRGLLLVGVHSNQRPGRATGFPIG